MQPALSVLYIFYVRLSRLLKHYVMLSNFFITWWPHHSSFPTVKFRRHPQRGWQIEVGTKNLQFSTSISEIPQLNTEQTWKNTDENTEYRYRLHIPIPTQVYCKLSVTVGLCMMSINSVTATVHDDTVKNVWMSLRARCTTLTKWLTIWLTERLANSSSRNVRS